MSTDYDTDARTPASVRRVGGVMTAGVSYALLALGVVAFWSFFAPVLDAPTVAWHAVILPEIVAPTEGDAMIDVSPLIAGLVVSLVAIWLR